MKDSPPDLVLSGINPGPNLGWDVLYSGTVAGAREGVLQGVPGVAFSLMPGSEMPFDEITPWVSQVIERMLAAPLEPFVCLNVNIPNPRKGPLKGMRATQLGQRFYSKDMSVRNDPRGKEYLWIGGSDVHMPDIPGSDCNAIREGLISVTPLTCNMTCRESLDLMGDWSANSGGK
jgi:5'-nucleotidase